MGNFYKGALSQSFADIPLRAFIRYYENHYDELTTPGSEIYEKVVHNFTTWGWCQIDPATCALARLIFLKINGKNEQNFVSEFINIINTKESVNREGFDELCEIAFSLIEKDKSKYHINFKATD